MRVTNPPQCIRCLSHSLGLSLLRSQANGPVDAMAVDADEGASGEGGVGGKGSETVSHAMDVDVTTPATIKNGVDVKE